MNKSYYRPDIDGLRALAVIPVILFHLNIAGFSGGFIGVDIFFVISGFLITSIIVRAISIQRFSFIEFWERRIRRIFPALFFVLLSTTIAGYFVIIFPPDFTDFGQSLAAQGLFLVNIFFMRVNDYFAAPTETLPLLHTWSLAVEEQFYIAFPFVLFGIFYIAKKYLVPTLLAATVCSFAYSVYLVNIHPNVPFSLPFIPHVWGGATNASAAFYFPLARAWELCAGALLAVITIEITRKSVAEAISLIGLSAIVLTIVFLNDTHSFPGLAALPPVLGTLALIVANKHHNTFVSQILSFPILVWVGLISYSLYLWHWPLIVLTQQYLNGHLSQLHINSILLTTFALAIFTYRYIETPFRTRVLFPKHWHIFTFGGSSVLLLVCAGVYISVNNGLPQRAPEAASIVAVAAADRNPREYECFRNNYRQILGEVPPCIIGDQSENLSPTFVLWGDSHANAAMPAFDAAGIATGRQGVFFAVGGCPPIITDTPFNKDPQCVVHNQKALAYINEHTIDTVFLVSSWKNTYPSPDESRPYSAHKAFVTTLNQIATSTHIVLMQRVPHQPDFDVRKLFYYAIETSVLPAASISEIAHNHDTRGSRDAIAQLSSERTNISSFDSNRALCLSGDCPINIHDSIVYTDKNHINTTGALLLTPLITPFLQKK